MLNIILQAVAAHSQYNCLIYNVNEGVATVTLNRPRKKNALNKEVSLYHMES